MLLANILLAVDEDDVKRAVEVADKLINATVSDDEKDKIETLHKNGDYEKILIDWSEKHYEEFTDKWILSRGLIAMDLEELMQMHVDLMKEFIKTL